MTLIALVAIVVLVALTVYIFFRVAPQIGGSASGPRLEVMQQSPNYKDGKFHNSVETIMSTPGIGVMIDFFKGGVNCDPDTTLITTPFDAGTFVPDSGQDKFTWFGHSSILLQLDGKNLLIDPVFGKRASMFSFMGPERYDYTQHVDVNDMPELDAVIISHDHYDHLDYHTFVQLRDKVQKFYVPLGVGAHLEAWGVSREAIIEMNWWDESSFSDEVRLAFVPSRHFSGRGLGDRFDTLWGAWVIMSGSKRVFFGGDSGYFPGFKEIGDKYGPFDLAMLECGQYNENWANIHMMPEETAQAGADLQAKSVMPVHWGKFTLSLHSWTEPVERFLKASADKDYQVVAPKLGEVVGLDQLSFHQWWKP